MGTCGTKLTEEEKHELKLSKELDKKNHKDFLEGQEKIKLLLLGAGESGKTTIFKQMKILYGAGFPPEERAKFYNSICSNIIEAMKSIVDASEELGYKNQIQVLDSFHYLKQAQFNDPITDELSEHIKALWMDPGIQETWAHRSQFQVIETCKSYFEKIDQIKNPNYIPTQEDVLFARIRTTGIIVERYEIKGSLFEMYDVGGQRNERKKWIHCFDDVNAVIFVAALSEYDQNLWEDNSVNRMVEAIHLFSRTVNLQWFQDTPMILFLNKRDLFEEKIKHVDIRSIEHFQDYNGEDNNYDDGTQYFQEKFLVTNKNEEKNIFPHITCATDTNNIEFVMNACLQIFLDDNLGESGF